MLKLTPGESVERSKHTLEMGEKELQTESKSRSQSKYNELTPSGFLLAQDLAMSCSSDTNSNEYQDSSDEEFFELPLPAQIIQGQFEEVKDSFACSTFPSASQTAKDDESEDKSSDDSDGEINDETISDSDDNQYKDADDILENCKFQDKNNQNGNSYSDNYGDGDNHDDNTEGPVDCYGQDNKGPNTNKDIHYGDGSKDTDNHEDNGDKSSNNHDSDVDNENRDITCNSVGDVTDDNGEDKNGNGESLFDKSNDERNSEKDKNNDPSNGNSHNDYFKRNVGIVMTVMMMIFLKVMVILMILRLISRIK